MEKPAGFHNWISSFNDGTQSRVITGGGTVHYTTTAPPTPAQMSLAASRGCSCTPHIVTSSVTPPPNSQSYWHANYYKGFRSCQ